MIARREGDPGLTRFLPHLREVRVPGIGSDLLAAVAVAALAIPQGMAYALVAGLPPEMGLLAAALPAAIAALWGSSPYLVTGPTNPIAILVGASVVGPAVAAGYGVPVGAVIETAALAGLFLLGFALFDLGRASRFVSDSVIAGFASGAGLLIAIGQVPAALGVRSAPLEPSPLAPASWPLFQAAFEAVGSVDPRALVLGLGVPTVVLVVRRLDRRLPGALLALAAAAILTEVTGWADGPAPLPLLRAVEVGWPTLSLPTLSDPLSLGSPALAIALLAAVQSIAAARALPMPAGSSLDPNRELFGQGVANLMSAAVGALPVCGSLTRSAVARGAGGRSRLAPMASGLLVALAMPFLALLASRVPLAGLAGLVVLSGLDLINPVALRRASVTRGDAIVLLGTLVATLWVDLVQAVYVGLLLALGLLVRRAGSLRMSELVVAPGGRLREIPVDAGTGRERAVVLNLEGDLSFAVAPELRDTLLAIAARGTRVMVLRLKRTPSLDATVLEVLRRVALQLSPGGTRILLCGLSEERIGLIRTTELGTALGEEGLVPSGARLAEGLERALARARQMIGAAPEETVFRTEAVEGGPEI